jgi:tetratricopeptide (TPR) repeat protein
MLSLLTSLLHLLLWLILSFLAILLIGLLASIPVFYIWRWSWEKRLWLKRTEELYKRRQAQEPDNPKWAAKLGFLYTSRMWRSTSQAREEAAKQSLRYYQEWLSLTDRQQLESDYSDLKKLAMAALEADATAEARIYANRLLKIAARHDDKGFGNSRHYGNMILGRLALRMGELEKAKEYLLKAGEIPGSPQLDSNGPGMALAKELLEQGERETVLQYFTLCARFWKHNHGKLQQWTSEVQRGRIPDFGRHLNR